MSKFRFQLTDEEKKYLKDLVRRSILHKLDPLENEGGPGEPLTEKLKEVFGAFVTLKKRGNLRGCIGNVQGTGEVYKTVWNMARAAAFEDPRFPALSREEFDELDIEISILSPIESCPDVEEIEIGRHGLIMSAQGRSGLLLPQVPVEWGWDRKKFLSQTCLKAGLPPEAWKEPGTTILWFEAEVF